MIRWTRSAALLLTLLAPLPCLSAKETTGSATAADATSSKDHPALQPGLKKGDRFMQLHKSFLKRGKEGPIGVLFLGDSITERWTSSPQVWKKHFANYEPANFGIGGDRTQHVLWRIAHGELDGIDPKVVVLLIGTNNANSDPPEIIAAAVKKIVGQIQEKLPKSKIVLMAVFPRNAKRDMPENKPGKTVQQVNAEIKNLADGKTIHWLDIGDKLLAGQATVPTDIMPDGVHLTAKGYEIWGESVAPLLEKLAK